MKTLLYIHNPDNIHGGGADLVTTSTIESGYFNKLLGEVDITEFKCNEYATFMKYYDELKYFDFIFMESNLSHISNKELVLLIKVLSHKCNKIYLRLHDSPLAVELRTNNTDSSWCKLNDEVVALYRYLSIVVNNLTYVVSNKRDSEFLNMIGCSAICIDLSYVHTNNMSDRLSTELVSNNILFATSYFSQVKGVIAYLWAILNDTDNKFNWYLSDIAITSDCSASCMFKSEHRYLIESIVNKPNVHVFNTNELSEYYKICKHVIIPSLIESYSFTAVEALSYGCNVHAFYTNYRLPWFSNKLVKPIETNLESFRYEVAGKQIYESINSEVTKINKFNDIELILASKFINYDKLGDSLYATY